MGSPAQSSRKTGQAGKVVKRYNKASKALQFALNPMLANKYQYRPLLFVAASFCWAFCCVPVLTSSMELRVRQSTEEEEQKTSAGTVEQLIEQLGAPTFSERQAAAEQLWNMGPVIIEPLRKGLSHPDPEVVKRVNSMVAAFELGIDANTARSSALMVMYFESGTPEMRRQIIRNLELQRDYKTIFELLLRVKDPDKRRSLYVDEISLDSVIYRLAMEDQWQLIDEMLTHEITWSYDFQLATYYAQLHGVLDKKIEQLIASADRDADRFGKSKATKVDKKEEEPAAKKSDANLKLDEDAKQLLFAKKKYQEDLMLLVRLLRVTNQRSKAIQYLNLIDNPVHKQKLGNRLLMEMGDWKGVEANLADVETNTTTKPGQLAATLSQRALIHYFTGNKVAFDDIIQRMENTVDSDIEPKRNKKAANPKKELLAIHLITLNWEEAKKYVDELERDEQFKIYNLLQRDQESFAAIGLGDDVEQRLVWFERLNKQLASIFRQYERASSGDGVVRRLNKKVGLIPIISDEKVYAKSQRVFRFGLDVANQLGALGLTLESVYHLRTLADTISPTDPNSRQMRQLILKSLVDMEQYEAAWEMIEHRFAKSEYAMLVGSLFARKSSHATYWMGVLTKEFSDELERLKAVASIINSPLQTPDIQIELEQSLAYVDATLTSPSVSARSKTNVELAMMQFFHGNFEKSRQYFEQAVRESNSMAEAFVANFDLESGDFGRAAENYDRLWKRTRTSTTNTYASIAAAICYEQMNETQNALRRKLTAYAAWLESYRTDDILRMVEQQKKYDRLAEFVNVSVHATTSSSLTNELYRYTLAMAQSENEPSSAYHNFQVYLFNQFASSDENSAQRMLALASQVNVVRAMAALEQGDLARVEQIVLKYNQFCPGDTSIFEQLIPALTKQGEHALAEKLFSQLTQFYSETLTAYPDSPLHQNNYGWACASARIRVDYAKDHSELAVRLRPENPSYLDTLAEIEFLLGDKEKALELSRRCLEKWPAKLHYQHQYLRFGGNF